MKLPILHIEGQTFPHSNAYITGNPQGLLILRDAINQALACIPHEGRGPTVFQNDGEGYHLTVKCLEDDERLMALKSAYTDPG